MSTRGIDASIVTEIETGVYHPVLLIDAAFEDSTGTTDTLYLFTGVGTIDYNGNTYTGTGTLMTIAGLEEVLNVASRGLTVTLDGIGVVETNSNGDTILDLAYRTEYQNRPFTLYVAVLDTSTRAIIGTPVQIFSGFMDVMDPQEDGETATITMTVENAMVALQKPVLRTYTEEDQKARYSGDTFFDQVAELQNMEIQLK